MERTQAFKGYLKAISWFGFAFGIIYIIGAIIASLGYAQGRGDEYDDPRNYQDYHTERSAREYLPGDRPDDRETIRRGESRDDARRRGCERGEYIECRDRNRTNRGTD